MNHRVFIAINLPESAKKELYLCRDRYFDLPARWTKKESLHVTLLFLGYVSDEELPEVCGICREIAKKHPAFSLELNKITYGPPDRKIPRMIWAQGEAVPELIELQKDLENALFENVSEKPSKDFHITLARLKQWEFQKIEPEEIPDVNQEISIKFPANSIEVMESELKREGPEYTILESAPLK